MSERELKPILVGLAPDVPPPMTLTVGDRAREIMRIDARGEVTIAEDATVEQMHLAIRQLAKFVPTARVGALREVIVPFIKAVQRLGCERANEQGGACADYYGDILLAVEAGWMQFDGQAVTQGASSQETRAGDFVRLCSHAANTLPNDQFGDAVRYLLTDLTEGWPFGEAQRHAGLLPV